MKYPSKIQIGNLMYIGDPAALARGNAQCMRSKRDVNLCEVKLIE